MAVAAGTDTTFWAGKEQQPSQVVPNMGDNFLTFLYSKRFSVLITLLNRGTKDFDSNHDNHDDDEVALLNPSHPHHHK